MCSGSGVVSEHAKKTLHGLLAQRPELKEGEYAQAIKGAMADEDALLMDNFKYEYAEAALSGSTVALCLINLTQGELICSNLGDSHIIFAERDPKTETPYHIVSNASPLGDIRWLTKIQRRLTKAHKPGMPDEQARIEEAGGRVEVRSGVPRLGESEPSHWPANTIQYNLIGRT